MNDNTKSMKVAYPITKNAKGEEFSNDSMEDFLLLLSGEASGRYLLGRNNMWHGGIHISSNTAPWCIPPEAHPPEVNTPPGIPIRNANTSAQPIRCMATGKIVAFRINNTYQDSLWDLYKTKYSSSFVLIKHEFIPPTPPAAPAPEGGNTPPPTDNSAGKLTFYSLYMHLAPWSTYLTGERVYKANINLQGRKDTKKWAIQATIEAGSTLRWDPDDPARQVTKKSGPNKGRVYGLVELVAYPEGKTEGQLKIGEKTWVTVDKHKKTEYIVAQESGITLPPWLVSWKKANKRDPEFNKVITVNPPVEIEAGHPVGYMGLVELPSPDGTAIQSCYRTHIELITPDDKIQTFLTNPLGLKGERQFVKYQPEKNRFSTEDKKTFTQLEQKTRSAGILTLTKLPKVTIKGAGGSKTVWYYILPEGAWMKEGADGLEILSQYDLEKLNFKTLDASQAKNMVPLDKNKKPSELVRDLLSHLKDQANTGTGVYQHMVELNCRRLISIIDSDNPLFYNNYEPDEYSRGIHQSYLRDWVNRMVVKHPSEWYDKSSDVIWKDYLEEQEKCDPESAEYNRKAIDNTVWMQEVPEFVGKKAIWHMHPVVFLWYLRPTVEWFDIEKFISIYKEQHTVVFGSYEKIQGTGTGRSNPVRYQKEQARPLNSASENGLRSLLYEMKKQYYSYFDEFSVKYIAYMLSTVRIESYDYRSTLYFTPIREIISYQKAETDYGSGPTAANRANAIAFGNTQIGDGYKYRGGGLAQITWKNNYKRFSNILDKDLVSNPEITTQLDIAVSIMMTGMRDGGFTGVSLSNYLSDGKNDYYQSRRIINGLDKARQFEEYAILFEKIINNSKG